MCKDCDYFRRLGERRCFICGEWLDKEAQMKYDPVMQGYKEKYPHGYIDASGHFNKNDW